MNDNIIDFFLSGLDPKSMIVIRNRIEQMLSNGSVMNLWDVSENTALLVHPNYCYISDSVGGHIMELHEQITSISELNNNMFIVNDNSTYDKYQKVYCVRKMIN